MCGRIRTKGLGKVLVGLALTAVAALGTAGSASATELSYTFNSSNQGWLQNQDPSSNNFDPAGFQAIGGNPGGRLSAEDAGPEDGCPDSKPCELLTFYSPIVPALAANYGGTGSFDLRSSVSPGSATELLLLPDGPRYLDGLIAESVGTGYHSLSIALNETANWAICPYSGGACAAPSQAEFKNLIAASDEIAVMADVGPDGTGETYDLDNVTLTDGPPQPPATPGPPAKHKKKCKKKKKKNHRAAAAKKKCKKKKKHRRATVARVRG